MGSRAKEELPYFSDSPFAPSSIKHAAKCDNVRVHASLQTAPGVLPGPPRALVLASRKMAPLATGTFSSALQTCSAFPTVLGALVLRAFSAAI